MPTRTISDRCQCGRILYRSGACPGCRLKRDKCSCRPLPSRDLTPADVDAIQTARRLRLIGPIYGGNNRWLVTSPDATLMPDTQLATARMMTMNQLREHVDGLLELRAKPAARATRVAHIAGFSFAVAGEHAKQLRLPMAVGE